MTASLFHLKYENKETKKKLGRGYKFYYYIIIYNSELGQLKAASLDSFFSSLVRGHCQSLEFTSASRAFIDVSVPRDAKNVLLTHLPDLYFIKKSSHTLI